jgi:hypothetical protein
MIVPYSSRHTRLTEAGTKENGAFYDLLEFGGHTTPQMTKRYVHPGKDDLMRAAKEGQRRRLLDGCGGCRRLRSGIQPVSGTSSMASRVASWAVNSRRWVPSTA